MEMPPNDCAAFIFNKMPINTFFPSSFNPSIIEHRLKRNSPWADFWKHLQVPPNPKL